MASVIERQRSEVRIQKSEVRGQKPGTGNREHKVKPIVFIAIGLVMWPAMFVFGDEKKPNILFLISDDQRADTVGALGNPRIRTPHLDELVRSGVTFTRAVCANPICVASRAEILTGNSGFRNGIMAIKGQRLKEPMPSWPRTLADAGYETWYVGKWHTTGRPSTWGYSDTLGLYAGGGGKWMESQKDWKGFEVTGYKGWIFQTDDGKLFPERGVGLTPDISSKFADAAIEFIRREPGKPFFLHVNFTAPHDPLFMPPGYEGVYPPEQMELPSNFLPEHPFDHGNLHGRDEDLLPFPRPRGLVKEVIAMYYAVISDLDDQVGRILAALDETGQRENTLIIYTSDHGLSLGSHGLRGKQNMYEHTVNVPLIVSGPGIPANERRDAQVYLRELFPTTCDVAGVEIPQNVEGKSFSKVLAGEEKSTHDEVFCYFRDCQRMVRKEGWKLIYYPLIDRYQLFDLGEDPYEQADLAGESKYKDRFEVLKKRLADWRVEVGDAGAE